MSLTREQRRSLGWDYAIRIGLAVLFIITGCAASGWATPGPGTYFIATACLIHAHGNRIRDTILALDTNRTLKETK